MGDWKKVVVESAAGEIAQEAATVSSIGNLTGDITSVNRVTEIGNGAISYAMCEFEDELQANDIPDGQIQIRHHEASGTASASTFLCGNNTWATPDAGTNNYLDGVTLSGTTVTYSISGGTDVTSGSIFGSNAFNSTGFTTNTGTVTGATGTAPVSVSNSTTSPVVSMAVATSTADGYLSSTDWGTFNGKTSNTGTVTTTGTINADEFARFDSDGVLEALTATEVRAALNVEDDADANRTISDAIDSSSSTTSASSAAAKAAYDRSWATVNNVSSTGTYESGTDAGPVLTFDGGSTATIPSAASGASGIVTSGTQTFGGAKTFASNVVITGTLTVDGGTTTVESTTVSVADKNIELASGATQASHADGGGITLKTTSVLSSSIQWRNGGSLAEWTLYRNGDATPLPIQVCMKEVTSGAPSGTEIDGIEGAMCYNSEDNDMYIYL